MVDTYSPQEMVERLQREVDETPEVLAEAVRKTAVESASRLQKYLVASGRRASIRVQDNEDNAILNLRGIGGASKVLTSVVKFGESELAKNVLGVDDNGVEQGSTDDGAAYAIS